MNIAYILPSLANKGPGIVVKDLCEGMQKLGHRCKVFYFDDIKGLEISCEVEQIKFFQKINFAEWDIIHTHMLRPDLWVFLHRPLIVKRNQKYITTIHQNIKDTLTLDYGKFTASFFGKLWKLSLKRFDNVVVLTQSHMNSISEIDDERKVVIFNGRNIDYSLKPDENDVFLIQKLKSRYSTIVGSNSLITKRKGLEQMIKALPLLPDCGYVVIGDGIELENLKQLALSLGVNDQCLFLGYRKDGYRYYDLFDVYLMISRSEGFPLSLIEAAAKRKATICTEIEIFKSIVDDKKVVFTPLDDNQKLAENINFALINKAQLSDEFYHYYLTNLTRKVMCSNYLKLYCL